MRKWDLSALEFSVIWQKTICTRWSSSSCWLSACTGSHVKSRDSILPIPFGKFNEKLLCLFVLRCDLQRFLTLAQGSFGKTVVIVENSKINAVVRVPGIHLQCLVETLFGIFSKARMLRVSSCHQVVVF